MKGKVVHFEVVTNGDAAELAKFYADTFGWGIDTNNPLKYGLISQEGQSASHGTNTSGGASW